MSNYFLNEVTNITQKIIPKKTIKNLNSVGKKEITSELYIDILDINHSKNQE